MTDAEIGPLFSYAPVRGPDLDQPRELKRVSGRIAETVLDFLRARIGREFRAADLHAYVAERKAGAPASADRVMRSLRQSGQVSFRVISRSESLYLCEAVR